MTMYACNVMYLYCTRMCTTCIVHVPVCVSLAHCQHFVNRISYKYCWSSSRSRLWTADIAHGGQHELGMHATAMPAVECTECSHVYCCHVLLSIYTSRWTGQLNVNVTYSIHVNSSVVYCIVIVTLVHSVTNWIAHISTQCIWHARLLLQALACQCSQLCLTPVVYSLCVCIIFTNQYCGFNVHNEQSTAIAHLPLVRVVACWWEGVIAMC